MPARPTTLRLLPDRRRVILKAFIPGDEILADGESRVAAVVERILAMPESEVSTTLTRTLADFSSRHRHFEDQLCQNYDLVSHHFNGEGLSGQRRLLIGAYFSHEYAVEAAALFNPSIVPSPDQSDLRAGSQRFVMSLRAVGEGHVSSVEFRSGVINANCEIELDEPGTHLVSGQRVPGCYDKDLFVGSLSELGYDNESVAFALEALPAEFRLADLEPVLASLHHHRPGKPVDSDTMSAIQRVAASTYDVTFAEDSQLSERVLAPVSSEESHGIEDARFVRFTQEDGTATFYATYTAFDGANVRSRLIETQDFRAFRIGPLHGRYAQNKGMAIFPRKIDGRYVALSRWDRENTTIVTTDNIRSWDTGDKLQTPEQPWELIQIGNCGSPLETPHGWLVLTHGVGPMRVYSIGAILLDLNQPSRVLAKLPGPLMVADASERDGYVPNVLYSCGAMMHGDHVILPYGFADYGTAVTVIPLATLLNELVEWHPGNP